VISQTSKRHDFSAFTLQNFPVTTNLQSIYRVSMLLRLRT